MVDSIYATSRHYHCKHCNHCNNYVFLFTTWTSIALACGTFWRKNCSFISNSIPKRPWKSKLLRGFDELNLLNISVATQRALCCKKLLVLAENEMSSYTTAIFHHLFWLDLFLFYFIFFKTLFLLSSRAIY